MGCRARCQQSPHGADPRFLRALGPPECAAKVTSYSPAGVTPRDACAFRPIGAHQPWWVPEAVTFAPLIRLSGAT